ncbi:methyltransferase domain-containing protein [Rhizobium sp. 32-5/1]|uniref:class I SAM-dependent DNA methyltransferase n=1 Tax=Rhizobium sp. 32-5/1 TaxID=3019602 RepID=UPI00240DC48A|nr:methyltransferase domain-containing protein [Rhizobium sp. 32-5/1]WEZ84545.1 methyltransferase domain-containing protein [Rhizobium sp. 32-5/1]
MNPHQLSSGDLIADRRAEYAHMLAETGEHAAAADLMMQALELVPDWAAGWFRLADYQEKSGATEAAVVALRKVLVLQPGDIFGASLKLAILGDTATPDQPSSLYVERLFDDYADRFDKALVERLEYIVPQTLAALVIEHCGIDRFSRVVDLGCGTGLFGAQIRDRTDVLEGFDLSANMLAKAEEKAIYDHLAQADLSLGPAASGVFGKVFDDGGRRSTSAMAGSLSQARADLVSAADVLMYLGALDSAFVIARQLLTPAGIFAFSVEDAGTDGDIVLRPSLRYAHSQHYVTGLCSTNGLDILAIRHTVIRKDGGKPVFGILFVTRKSP